MPWYTWVFSGVGAAIAVPLMGWILTRFPRKQPDGGVAGLAGGAAPPAALATPSASNTTAGTSPLPVPGPPAVTSPPATAGSSTTTGASPAPAAAVPVTTAFPGTTSQSGPQPTSLVDFLLAIPEMNDPAFRQLLYSHLPQQVVQQLRMDRPARIELLGLIDTFNRYPQLHPWQSLIDRMAELLPAQPAVAQLAGELARLGLAGSP